MTEYLIASDPGPTVSRKCLERGPNMARRSSEAKRELVIIGTPSIIRRNKYIYIYTAFPKGLESSLANTHITTIRILLSDLFNSLNITQKLIFLRRLY